MGDVGRNIRYYRRINDLTQKDLAKKLGVTEQAVSSWELNRTEPNMGMVNKMAHIFDCSISNIAFSKEESVPEYDPIIMDIIQHLSRATEEQKNAVLALVRSF